MFYLCIRLITKHMDEITKIETVDQYDQLFGLETLHPLVNVIDFSKATKSVEYIRMNIGFYCLFLKDAKCGDLTYGRKNYDYQEGTVVCMAPGQVSGIDNRNRTAPRTKSIGVLFHPDLIRGTSLGQNIKNYTFFSYEVNEALHLSDQEREIVTDCIHKIRLELEHTIDKHSKQLIVRNIELLLDYCLIKKNVPWHILAPRAVACDSLHLRASAHLWHVSAFLCNRKFVGISCYIKNPGSVYTSGRIFWH